MCYFLKYSSDIFFFHYLLLFYNYYTMEIKNQKSEKGSEISYLKLENTRDVQTPQQGGFTMKQMVLKHLLQTNLQKPSVAPPQEGPFNYESDDGFLSELFQILEKHEPSLSQRQQKNPLDEQTCQYIHNLCIRHSLANKFNQYSDFEVQNVPAQKKCICGCGKAEGQPLSLCTDQLEHYFFGPTILIFFFMRKVIILLIVIALIYGLFSMITNIIEAPELGDKCSQNAGMLSFLCPTKYLVSTLNKLNNSNLLRIQVWLGFLLCFVWIVSIRVLRSMGRILNRKIDSFLDSSSDYMIQITNLPNGNYTETDLLRYIAALWKSKKGKTVKPPAIKSVLIIYNMEEVRKMIKTVISNAQSLAKHLNKRNHNGKDLYEIKQGHLELYLNSKMNLIQSLIRIQDYREKFIKNAQFRKQLATDQAFIQFFDTNDQCLILNETKQYRITILAQMKEYVMKQIFPNQDTYVFKGNSIRITRAPEPSDINWLNCELKNSYKRIAFVWLIAFCILCVSFGFLTLIRFLRSNFAVLQSLSILVSISLQAFNRIIWNTLVSTVSLQQNNTVTDNQISIMSKGAFAQTINVLVVPFIFNYVMRKNLYGPEGMISSTLDYHFTYILMQIFLNFINVPYQMKRISINIKCVRNWIIRKYSKIVGEVDTAEQIKQVIEYYQAPSFSIASVYTSINTIIFHTMFYIHIQPVLIFSLIFNITAVYLMQKYLLLRRYKIPELVDFIIFQNCCSYLMHVPAIYAAGSITFIYLTSTTTDTTTFDWNYIPSILCIVFWAVCVMNPFSIFNKVTKCVVSKFGYNQNQTYTKNTNENTEQKIAQCVSNGDSEQNKIFKRIQSYYNRCGTNDLLEYEAKLTEIRKNQDYQNQNKIFCQRFSLKPENYSLMVASMNKRNTQVKKSSRKLLPKMKQSFMVLKQSQKKATQNIKKINNKVVPIDIYQLNQKVMEKEESIFDDKQNKEPIKLMKTSKKTEDKKQQDSTKNRLVISRISKQFND